MLRLFLPIEVGDRNVPWKELLPLDAELTGETSLDVVRDDASSAGRTQPSHSASGGILDRLTAAGLRECLYDVALTGAWWRGYADAVHGPLWSESPDYSLFRFQPSELEAGARVPEFCWDGDGRFAWGGRLYPDSLVIAAEPDLLKRLHANGNLETAGVVASRDRLPFSIAD